MTNRSPTHTDGDPNAYCGCKVGRIAAERDLDRLVSQMADRWRHDEASLRSLETEFNTAVLRVALEAADIDAVQGEASNYYRLLTDDDVTSGSRIEARRRLERRGVDIDGVSDAFVSHQTIHNHFTDCLGVELNHDTPEPTVTGKDRIRPLRGRLETVTTDVLKRLRREDVIALGRFDVYVDVKITCSDCGARRSVETLIDTGGCECER